jgi:hypothetical protein
MSRDACPYQAQSIAGLCPNPRNRLPFKLETNCKSTGRNILCIPDANLAVRIFAYEGFAVYVIPERTVIHDPDTI